MDHERLDSSLRPPIRKLDAKTQRREEKRLAMTKLSVNSESSVTYLFLRCKVSHGDRREHGEDLPFRGQYPDRKEDLTQRRQGAKS